MEVEAKILKLPNWARALAVVGGIASLIAGILVLVYPGLGILFVVYLLGLALTLLGFERLSTGIVGQAYTISARKQPQPQD